MPDLWRGMICLSLAVGFEEDRVSLGLPAAVDRLRDALDFNGLTLDGDDRMPATVLAGAVEGVDVAEWDLLAAADGTGRVALSVDFRTLSDRQLAELLAWNAHEFDDMMTMGLSADRLFQEFAAGRAVFEVDEHAIGVVRPEGWDCERPQSVFWLLYVDPAFRRAGHAWALTKRIIAKHVVKHPIVLLCHGKEREALFRACGFRLERRTLGGGRMVTRPRQRPKSGRRPAPASAPTTQVGYVNRNGQTVVRATDLPGTDHLQRVYVLRCGKWGNEYGANGSDIHQRKCPKCDGGRPGLAY